MDPRTTRTTPVSLFTTAKTSTTRRTPLTSGAAPSPTSPGTALDPRTRRLDLARRDHRGVGRFEPEAVEDEPQDGLRAPPIARPHSGPRGPRDGVEPASTSSPGVGVPFQVRPPEDSSSRVEAERAASRKTRAATRLSDALASTGTQRPTIGACRKGELATILAPCGSRAFESWPSRASTSALRILSLSERSSAMGTPARPLGALVGAIVRDRHVFPRRTESPPQARGRERDPPGSTCTMELTIEEPIQLDPRVPEPRLDRLSSRAFTPLDGRGERGVPPPSAQPRVLPHDPVEPSEEGRGR